MPHVVRTLASMISDADNTPSEVVSLEQRLFESGRAAVAASAGRVNMRPLFREPKRAVDASAPEFQARVEEASILAVRDVQERNSRELAEISERYASTFMRLDEAIASIPRVVTSEVVDLALLVAQEVLHAELSVREDLVFAAVERALNGAPHDGTVTVRMNPDDLEGVETRLKDSGMLAMKCEADASLRRGDCVVQTPGRIIDASLDARLEAVRDTLVRTLMAEEQEGASE